MSGHVWDGALERLREFDPQVPFVCMLGRAVAVTIFAVGVLLTAVDMLASAGTGMVLSELAVCGVGCSVWWVAGAKRLRFFDRALANSFTWRRAPVPLPRDIILWWELRRIPYNLIVGACGVMSGIVALVCAGISEARGGDPVGIPDGIFILAAPILFGVAANVFYTGGWVVELAIRRLLNANLRGFAPLSFTLGLGFSMGLTALPALFASTYMLALLAGWVPPSGYHSAP